MKTTKKGNTPRGRGRTLPLSVLSLALAVPALPLVTLILVSASPVIHALLLVGVFFAGAYLALHGLYRLGPIEARVRGRARWSHGDVAFSSAGTLAGFLLLVSAAVAVFRYLLPLVS